MYENEEAELQKLRDIGFTEFQAQHILFFARENAEAEEERDGARYERI